MNAAGHRNGVFVGDHGAFGLACGAAGVTDRAQVIYCAGLEGTRQSAYKM